MHPVVARHAPPHADAHIRPSSQRDPGPADLSNTKTPDARGDWGGLKGRGSRAFVPDSLIGTRAPARATRLNSEAEWVRNAVPELRIVSDDLWAAAKRQQAALAERHAGIKEAAQARALNSARRPAYCSRAFSNAVSAAVFMRSS